MSTSYLAYCLGPPNTSFILSTPGKAVRWDSTLSSRIYMQPSPLLSQIESGVAVQQCKSAVLENGDVIRPSLFVAVTKSFVDPALNVPPHLARIYEIIARPDGKALCGVLIQKVTLGSEVLPYRMRRIQLSDEYLFTDIKVSLLHCCSSRSSPFSFRFRALSAWSIPFTTVSQITALSHRPGAYDPNDNGWVIIPTNTSMTSHRMISYLTSRKCETRGSSNIGSLSIRSVIKA